MTNRVNTINPEMLKWARESSGLSLEEVSRKMGFSVKENEIPRLKKFENGEVYPTHKQLNNLAKIYHQPSLVFYLNDPPNNKNNSVDFRKQSISVSRRQNALLDALVRKIELKQEIVLDLFENQNNVQELKFVGSANRNQVPKEIAQEIARTIGFNNLEKRNRKGGPEKLFKVLRSKIESVGIFVLIAGDLGSYHSKLGTDVFRGFAIADSNAPFIVINSNDAISARSFTLMHELAHIWLGKSGVSGIPSGDLPETENELVERYCNDVASEFLFPEEYMNDSIQDLANLQGNQLIEVISTIAQDWSVSDSMVAYKLKRFGIIESQEYNKITQLYYTRWQKYKERLQKKSSGGPDRNIVIQHRMGDHLLRTVMNSIKSGRLTFSKAALALEIAPVSVESFINSWLKSKQSG